MHITAADRVFSLFRLFVLLVCLLVFFFVCLFVFCLI